ncbi:hypothetical protein HD806DRAFT_540324 [Xylariaceae sp. AK1471]|nr:hypothetical protein HD806DRAFT_540324 [Xylariaceae sp. AK1471]
MLSYSDTESSSESSWSRSSRHEVFRSAISRNYRGELSKRFNGGRHCAVCNWHCRIYDPAAPHPTYGVPRQRKAHLTQEQQTLEFGSKYFYNRRLKSKGKEKANPKREAIGGGATDYVTKLISQPSNISPQVGGPSKAVHRAQRQTTSRFSKTSSNSSILSSVFDNDDTDCRSTDGKGSDGEYRELQVGGNEDDVQSLLSEPEHENPEYFSSFLLPCEFYGFGPCDRLFASDDVEAWIQHIVSDHLEDKLPNRCLCWFCDDYDFKTQDGGDRMTNFENRMWHIREHLIEGCTISDMRPDFFFMDHLYECGLITTYTYRYARRHQETIQKIPHIVPFNFIPSEGQKLNSRSNMVIVNQAKEDQDRQRQISRHRREANEKRSPSEDPSGMQRPRSSTTLRGQTLKLPQLDSHESPSMVPQLGCCENLSEADVQAHREADDKFSVVGPEEGVNRMARVTARAVVVIESRIRKPLFESSETLDSMSLKHSPFSSYIGSPRPRSMSFKNYLSSSYAGSPQPQSHWKDARRSSLLNQHDASGSHIHKESKLASSSSRGDDKTRERSHSRLVVNTRASRHKVGQKNDENAEPYRSTTVLSQISLGFRRSFATLRRLFWPKLPSHLMRVSWICRCGQYLYIDFHPSDKQAAVEFAQAASGSASSISVSGSEHRRYQSQASSSRSDVVTRTESDVSNTTELLTPAQIQPESIFTAPDLAPGTKKYLLLCVNTGHHEIKVQHVDLTNIALDVSLFSLIRKEYESMRGPLTRNIFMIPKTVEYVKFELLLRKLTGECVGNYQKNSIPGKNEVMNKEYELWPCPPRIGTMPIQSHVFMHSFLNPGDHLGGLAVRQLPKQLGRKLKCVTQPEPFDVPFGWGVYIIEGLNTLLVSVVLTGVLLIVTVTVLLWSALRNDVQGGTGIGQYALAAVGTVVAIGALTWKPLRDVA